MCGLIAFSFSFIEIVGYTDRWTWGKSSLLWEEALQHHYANNPHHPQFYQDKRMTRESLEESIVDMMACHWERKEGGGDEVPAEKIAGFSDFYLERYLTPFLSSSKIFFVKPDSTLFFVSKTSSKSTLKSHADHINRDLTLTFSPYGAHYRPISS